MCDYSLEMYASRPARESEFYVTTRFASGSIGLASPGDCGTAICVQYDTHLLLENLPEHARSERDMHSAEVVFARIETGAYHDAVAFPDGRVVSLQQLGVGVTVSVRALLDMLSTPDTARHIELVA